MLTNMSLGFVLSLSSGSGFTPYLTPYFIKVCVCVCESFGKVNELRQTHSI